MHDGLISGWLGARDGGDIKQVGILNSNPEGLTYHASPHLSEPLSFDLLEVPAFLITQLYAHVAESRAVLQDLIDGVIGKCGNEIEHSSEIFLDEEGYCLEVRGDCAFVYSPIETPELINSDREMICALYERAELLRIMLRIDSIVQDFLECNTYRTRSEYFHADLGQIEFKYLLVGKAAMLKAIERGFELPSPF